MIHLGSNHFALDIGSTSIKGCVLDVESGQIAGVCTRPFPAPMGNLPSSSIEIDPRAVLEVVESIVDELTSEMGSQCHGWICGQMGGVILADDRGRAKSNYLSWRDQRSLVSGGSGRCTLDRLREDWPEPIMASLGRELQPGSTSTLLHWLSEHRQLRDGVMPLSIADFVIANVARQPGRMHGTHAIGLLDLQKDDWHYEAFERIGLGDLWWPELIRDASQIALWKRGDRTIALHGAFGDQQSALLGARLASDELSINISTGSQVSMLTDSFRSGPYQTRKYFGNQWLNTVTHLPAGRSLNALMQLLTELSEAESVPLERPWKTVQEKMESVAETDLQANIAYFASPVGKSGTLENMTTENLSVGHLFLAACVSMANNYETAAKRLSSRQDWSQLALSGGLAQSLPRLVSLIQSRFKKPIRESIGEETLLGMLQLAQQHTIQSSSH
ncbi:MAG: sedoheptulokinase [Pirellula sp.]